MILSALAAYEDQDDEATPFGYARKPLGYTLVLWRDGEGCRLVAHHDDKGRGVEALIPNLARTVKAMPFLGCDNAAYVLGKERPGETSVKTTAKHELFVDLVRDFDKATPGAQSAAYLRWIEAGKPGLTVQLDALVGASAKRIDMDPIGIAVEGISASMHDTPAARQFWAERARSGKEGKDTALCVVCGQFRPTVASFPQSVIGHLVPGATQANVALASVNFPAASRGASGTGLRSAPVCADCASKAVQNLNSLAGSASHSWRSPGGELSMVWWATDPLAEDILAVITQARPELVAGLFRSAHGARPDTMWKPRSQDRFHALTFSGNVARFVVRRWVSLPLDKLHANVTGWFEDVESASSEHPYFPLFRYAASLGPLRREQGRWVTPAPIGAVEALLMTALAGDPVPANLLHLALSRSAAEIRLTTADDPMSAAIARRRMEARVGLLKLILNRTVTKERRMPAHLDQDRRDAAYVNGRLFAAREALQAAALGKVNASIVDKFFERASTNPSAVAQPLEVLSKQHLRKLRRERGEAAFLRQDTLIHELNDLQDQAPGRLTAEQQAAWLCGYHQQRMYDIDQARARKAEKQAREASAPSSIAISHDTTND